MMATGHALLLMINAMLIGQQIQTTMLLHLLLPATFCTSLTQAPLSNSPCKYDFTELNVVPPRPIKGINGSTIMAIGVGDIILHLPSGNKFTLCNVLYIPDAAIRLISVSKLADTGLTSTFTKDHPQVHDSMNDIILIGSRNTGGLYLVTNITPPIEWESLAKAPATLETWHHCLGHISYTSIIKLAMKHMVTTDVSSIPPLCEHCILGKQTKNLDPKQQVGERSTGLLDTVFSDITGLRMYPLVVNCTL